MDGCFTGDQYYELKRSSPLMKLVKVFCDRHACKMYEVWFMYNGTPINPEMTPSQVSVCACIFIIRLHDLICIYLFNSQLEMDDGDVIEVIYQH